MRDAATFKSQVWATSSQYDERNDCSVKAVAITTGAGYEAAHAAIERQGRQRRGCSNINQQLATIKELGYTYEAHDFLRQPNGSRYTPKTIGRFCHTGNWTVKSWIGQTAGNTELNAHIK